MIRTLIAVCCALALLLGVHCSYADPVQSELKAYRCLVPDWSKTSGGTSPALSPDGKTLVFLVHNPGQSSDDQVWIVPDVDQYDPGEKNAERPTKLPEQWQLKIEFPPEVRQDVHVWLTSYTPDLRNVDWSPDGTRVAFIFNARLFVAEHADLKARSAKPRLLADVRLVPPESAPPGTDPKAQQYAEPVLAPRWSPDGTRIAFLRPSPPPGGKDELCVVDVITGKESVAANDTIAGIGVFGQPWSPDGKSLAYAAAVTTSGGYTPAGINVVAATGGKPRTAIERGSRVACSASWSPNGNRLAYVGPLWSAGIIGSALPTVFVSDIDGKNAAPVTADVPSESKRAAAEVQMRERLIKMLKEKYPGVFSAAQLKEFARKRLADIQAIVILASAESVRQLEADIKHFPTGDKNKLSAGGAVGEAVEKLPKEQQGKLKEKLTQLVLEVIRPLLNLKASLDTDPVWSPDGANLAYTRWNFTSGVMQLVIVDLATRKARTVFESNTIECVSWTADGKSLVLQARRNLAYKGKSDTAKNPWPDFITMPSYPEIWLLDLK